MAIAWRSAERHAPQPQCSACAGTSEYYWLELCATQRCSSPAKSVSGCTPVYRIKSWRVETVRVSDLCRYLRCPENCSGNGVCLMNGTCVCGEGWTGDGCSLPTCPNNCSYPKGTCQSQQTCICDTNYHGNASPVLCIDGILYID